MRRRIVGIAALSAALSLLLFGVPLAVGVSYYVRLHERDALIRLAYAVASAAPDNLSSGAELTRTPGLGGTYRVGLYDRGAHLVSGEADPGALSLVKAAIAGQTSVRTVDGQLSVAIPVRDNGKTVGAVLATSRAHEWREIIFGWLAVFGLALAVLTVTWIVARRYARRVATPLEQLAVQADLLPTGEVREAVPASGIAEVDEVSAAIVRASARLDTLIERERAFSTVASHQLRTPLMRLSLALENALAADDARPEINHALAIVTRLDNTVTDVLHLARGDAPAQAVDLEQLFDDVAARWEATPHDPARAIVFARDGATPLAQASERAVRQVLNVLIDNAAEHGRGTVTITARDAQGALAIDVAQEGSTPEAPRPDRFSSPLGLGLRYARTIAEAHGARLILRGTAPVTFTLVIPALAATGEPRGDGAG